MRQDLTHSRVESVKSSTSTSVLDAMKDKAHHLIKKFNILIKEISKIESAMSGCMDMFKVWTKTTNSEKKNRVSQLVKELDSVKDEKNVEHYQNRLANHRNAEMNIIAAAQSGLKALIEALEVDNEIIAKELKAKSTRLSHIKREMEEDEPGKQIPATLRVNPDSNR